MDKCTHISTTTWLKDMFCTLETLQKLRPGEYDDLVLEKDEVLVREHFYGDGISGIGNLYSSYLIKSSEVVGTFPDEYCFELVVSEEKYQEILRAMFIQGRKMLIYTDDKDASAAFFDNLDSKVTAKMRFIISDLYEEEYAVYREARRIKLDARMVITITTVAISLVVLYFSMKSCAIKNIQNIAAYRLLGIKKGSIALIYAGEAAFLTTFTSLPAVLITTGIMKFLASVPSLEMNLVYPWWAMFATLVFLYVANCIAGILPIIGILRLPPAKLAAKYGL